MVALARTDGGVDELGEAAALHQDADVRQAAVEAAAVPHPHHCQHRCHDNQLHSQLGAAQRPDEASRQTLETCKKKAGLGKRRHFLFGKQAILDALEIFIYLLQSLRNRSKQSHEILGHFLCNRTVPVER